MLHYFLGGSVTRGLYKDLIWLLNTDTLIDYGVGNFYIHHNIYIHRLMVTIYSLDSGDKGRG